MSCTFKCNKCSFAVRVCSESELEQFQKIHNKKCDGMLESVWKNYEQMSKKQKEKLSKNLFKYGILKC